MRRLLRLPPAGLAEVLAQMAEGGRLLAGWHGGVDQGAAIVPKIDLADGSESAHMLAGRHSDRQRALARAPTAENGNKPAQSSGARKPKKYRLHHEGP